jgi:hypothetical protein
MAEDEEREATARDGDGEEATHEAEVEAGEKGQHKPSEEELAGQMREELKALRVADIAHDMMLTLVTVGYQKLGLTDETKELRNLDDARLAIDLLRGVIEVLGAVTGEQVVAPFRSTLAAMQMNFARVAAPPAPRQAASGEPGGETAKPAAHGEGDVAAAGNATSGSGKQD